MSIGMMAITPVPRTPDYVKGVVNLRGKVIPVVDSVSEVLNIQETEIEDAPTFRKRQGLHQPACCP